MESMTLEPQLKATRCGPCGLSGSLGEGRQRRDEAPLAPVFWPSLNAGHRQLCALKTVSLISADTRDSTLIWCCCWAIIHNKAQV